MRNLGLNFTVMLLLLTVFLSCNKEKDIVSLDNAKKNEFINPFNFVGVHHNKILDETYNQAINNGGVYPNKTELINIIVGYAVENLSISEEDARDAVVSNTTPNFADHLDFYFKELDKAFDNYTDTTSFDALYAQISALEIAANQDVRLTEDEKKLVLGTCAIAHHSLTFWKNNLIKFLRLNDNHKKNIFGRICDFIRAVCKTVKADYNGYQIMPTQESGIIYGSFMSADAWDDRK